MSIRSRSCVALLTLIATASPCARPAGQEPAHPDASEVAPHEALRGLSWLAGSWQGEMGGGQFSAYYSTPVGGKILSHSRLVKDEQEAFYEFELFEVRDHVVHLQPFPGGKQAESFALKSLDPKTRKAVFENPDKDFPTRIAYQRVSDEGLEITLTDPHGGSDAVQRYVLSR